MDWMVRLGGDEWSLQGLCDVFRGVQPRVWREDDGLYYLSSPALSSCVDEDEACREADRLVSRINDAAALDREHHPIEASAVVQVDSHSTRRFFVRAKGTAAGTSRCRGVAMGIRSDGTVAPPGPSWVERLYAALEREGDKGPLARALQAWRSRERDWALLYHVYEIIKEDVSSGTNYHKDLQTVTPVGMTWLELDQELNRLRNTSRNPDPDYAGTLARHGKTDRKPISNPMQLREAEDLIWRLLQRWAETKV